MASSQPKPQPETFDPPPYAQTSAQKVNLSDIEKQQQELNRRAAELDRRERLLSSGQNTEGFISFFVKNIFISKVIFIKLNFGK